MYKSCFVSIIGKPNAGKSTLLNTLIGQKISIVSWRPQTTRNIITGVMHGEGYQIVFLDTPGIQHGKSLLNEYMSKSVRTARAGADATLYVADGSKRIDEDEYIQIQRTADAAKAPFIVAVNKTDAADRELLVKNLLRFNDADMKRVTAVVPISALKGANIDALKSELKKFLKEGGEYYSEDMITDKNLRFLAGEIIREKALLYLEREIPHGVGVGITRYTLRGDGGIADIEAEILAEKQSHKPIIIGKGGAMLKKIASAARRDIEKISGERVFLRIWVKVREDWQDNYSLLKELGYDKKDI
ncbi:MAG: GTPase Era [Clostridiales bacterium]|jgi:GTP-binding protein Era|nr:GTPase Era [Clostridiales bacterium]